MNLAELVKTDGAKSTLKIPPDARTAAVFRARKLLARSLRLERWATTQRSPRRAWAAEDCATAIRERALALLAGL